MTTAAHEIVQAAREDIDGILDLQERNQPERGGTLSARLPRDRSVEKGSWRPLRAVRPPTRTAKERGKV